jgi:quinol-cytochrome oxidoreductase complex cytochrome b subunit
LTIKDTWASFSKNIAKSTIWKSIFRHGFPDNRRDQMLIMLTNVWMHLHPTRLKRHGVKVRYTWCMGGITFFLFLMLTLTGVLLMYYYVPYEGRIGFREAEGAYRDMKDLQFVVPLGMILRNLHRRSAHAMVIAVWLHMARVFYTGSYKPPREFNWVIGVLLLTLTLLLSFTGYLLPWDQLAFWAVTVGTNMAKATPLLGAEGPFSEAVGLVDVKTDVRAALLGGTIVGQSALLRFYVWHCVGFPLIAGIFMIVHFWRVRKDGGISGPM